MTAQFTTGGGRNYSKFSDPQLDDLVHKALLELNSAPVVSTSSRT